LRKAILYMIISAIAFTVLNVFVKSLKGFNVFQIVFFRSLGSLFFTIPLLLKLKISPLGNNKVLLVLRSVFGLTSMTLFFLSLEYIDVGASVAIRYMSPIFASIFAIFLLKEKIKIQQWFFFLIAFIGVVLLKDFEADLNIKGLLFALLSAFFAGLVYIIIRKIGDKDHPLVVVNYFMIISMILGGVITIKYWQTPTFNQLLLFLSLGVFGYFAQFYMTKAMQTGETNQIAPLKYLEVICTIIIGVIWLDETYTLLNLSGVLLIVLGLICNLFAKQKEL